MFKWLVLTFFACVSLAGCAKGSDCLTDDCLTQAKAILVAKIGSADDKFNLGYAYYAGTPPFKKDNVEAVKWYQGAAELGHMKAQYNLGTMYSAGEGVTQDKAKAFYWFKKAAEQGDADAQFNVGNMYKRGEGVEKNKLLAIEWYTKALDQGDTEAAFNLGYLYLEEEPISKEQAKKWLLLAAQRSAKMQHKLANLHLNGKLGSSPQEAFNIFHQAASRGYGQSQVYMGIMYRDGFGVTKSVSDAYAWFSIANTSDGRIDDNYDYIPDLVSGMTSEQIEEGERKKAELLKQIKPEKW